MHIDSKILSAAVKSLLGVTDEGKYIKPILGHIRFQPKPHDGAGMVAMAATNLDVCLTVHVPANCGETKEPFTAEAAVLGQAIRAVKGKSVLAALTPNCQSLRVETDAYAASVPMLDPEEFPVITEYGRQAATIDGTRFSRLLARVLPVACRDASRHHLCGVYVEIGDGKLKLTATDGKRLAHAEMPAVTGDPYSCILPTRAAKAIAGLATAADTCVGIHVLPERISFLATTWTITARVVDGTYPDYASAMPKAEQGFVSMCISRDALANALETACGMSVVKENSWIAIATDPDTQHARLSTFQDAWTTSLPAESREAHVAHLSPFFLLEAVKCFERKSDLTILLPKGTHLAILMAGAAEDGYRHYVVPLIVKVTP